MVNVLLLGQSGVLPTRFPIVVDGFDGFNFARTWQVALIGIEQLHNHAAFCRTCDIIEFSQRCHGRGVRDWRYRLALEQGCFEGRQSVFPSHHDHHR